VREARGEADLAASDLLFTAEGEDRFEEVRAGGVTISTSTCACSFGEFSVQGGVFAAIPSVYWSCWRSVVT
jgi:hypothetical protein